VAVLLQVNELTMQNEYQLRLKDLAMNEKVKELTEKFTAELDVDKTKFDTLLQEKNEQELDYEEKMKQYEEKHQAQLTTLDGQYQAKIMAEVERRGFFCFFACFHVVYGMFCHVCYCSLLVNVVGRKRNRAMPSGMLTLPQLALPSQKKVAALLLGLCTYDSHRQGQFESSWSLRSTLPEISRDK